MKIKWSNLSKITVNEIPFKFQPDSTGTVVMKVMINDIKQDFRYVLKEDRGFDGFVVKLKDSLKENETVNIEIDFKTRKSEYFREKLLFFSKDIPLIPYFKDGEFNPNYQVHSNYNVDISYPVDFNIATSGFINKRDTVNGLIKVQTTAKEIPWYGLILFKDLVVDEYITAENVLIRSVYFEDDEKWGTKLMEHSKDIIAFYVDTLGFYPQSHINIMPGYDKPYGGWPICPNIVGIHRGIDQKKERAETHAHWIMAHEIGHQYWGFNYVLEPTDYPQWFGISMGIYTDMLYSQEKGVNAKHNARFFRRYTDGVKKGLNTTMMQKIDSLDKQDFDWNNVIKHGKSFAFLRVLAYEIGEDNFFKAFKYCLENYKGVNVTPEMFQKDCERISNKNLSQFFHQWVYTNDYLEYQIDEVNIENENDNYKVIVKVNNLGKINTPNVDLGFILNNGDTIIKTFNGKTKQETIVEEFQYTVEKIILDPDYKLPLVNIKSWNKNQAI
ncbi:MAG: M1 family metallopeptidase [bacterium]|nr:M1 family metallopeptidase [bacterium]